MNESYDSGRGAASGTAATGTDVLARETYRHLRLMLATLPALILLAILALALRGTVEDSISAYYGQPVRDLFVGAMVGIAVCLIVYRGFPPFEDYALNLAGFFAFFVAFVPNTLADDLAKLSEADRSEALFGLRASIAAVVLATLLFVGMEWRLGHWTLPTLWQRPITRWVLIVANVLVGVFLVLVVVNGIFHDHFANVHVSAAILLFASLAMAVAAHAWPGRFGSPGDPRHRTVFWLMVAGIPLALVLEFVIKSESTVIILEAWEILLFFSFWVVEARRTWHAPVPG
ncbi:MAG TPA: hypothetical protein VF557_20370 [Jatrophihabitans sp.]|jgi:hypothetical protein|uniref:hypothetical protein n=1 Tax=Jatrophihabitans sp. TaxID=1932789 RepID=UPI002F1284BF